MRRSLMLACAAGLALGAGAAAARADTTLVVSIAADPTGFDPEAVQNNTSGFIMATVYDSLIDLQARHHRGRAPGLAKSWEISPDGLTYTFHLRTGVKFHDGIAVQRAGLHQDARPPAQEGRPQLHLQHRPGRRIRGLHLRLRRVLLGDRRQYRAVQDEGAATRPSSTASRWCGTASSATTPPPSTARISATIRSAPARSSSANGSRATRSCSMPTRPTGRASRRSTTWSSRNTRTRRRRCWRCKRGETQIMGDVATQVIPALHADQQHRRADPARPDRQRHGDAERHRRRSTTSASARRSTTRWTRTAINKALYARARGDDDLAAAAGAVGLRPVAEGLSVRSGEGEAAARGGRRASRGCKVELLTYNTPRGYNPAGPDLAVGVAGLPQEGRRRGRHPQARHGRLPRHGALRQVSRACSSPAGAATTATPTTSSTPLWGSDEHAGERHRRTTRTRGRHADAAKRRQRSTTTSGCRCTRQIQKMILRRRAVGLRQLDAAGPRDAQEREGLPAQPDADVLRHGAGLAAEVS